jgi:hypothetical protein
MTYDRFVQFYALTTNPVTNHVGMEEVLGSDGVAYLDGRWSIGTCHEQARRIAHSRRKVKKIDGYRIMRGSHTSPFALTARVMPV